MSLTSNQHPIVLAIDMMGGDFGLDTTLPACRDFCAHHPNAQLRLVGDEAAIKAHPNAAALLALPQVHIIHAPEVVTMDDPLEIALRRKKNSSMRIAINQVKDAQAQAAVSAGNTGALMAIAQFVLKTLDGIERPAIASMLPNAMGTGTTVLDLGANVDCSAEHLQQFGLMGSAFVSATMSHSHASNPRVGLLNIGHEDIKGNKVVKLAAPLLKASPIHFIGNVEGSDIFKGTVDVVVCDGFVGNVLLKTTEGFSGLVRNRLNHSFKSTLWRKLGALFALPALNAFKSEFDSRKFNGAALLGLRGVVIKSHGGADAVAFGYALQRAHDAVAHDMLNKTSAMLAQLHAQQN